jgi:hypothetical protein
MLALLLLACAPEAPVDTAPADMRLDPGAYPAPADGERWLGPDVTIEPGTEKQYCLFGTWTGPDVGLYAYASHQAAIGHHLVLLGTTASAQDYPDGTVVDCTDTGSLMTSFSPLITPEPVGQGETAITLPDGFAVKLREGQRWIVQAHYVNTLPEPARVQDVLTLAWRPEDEVSTWAAALALNHDSFSLAPQQETTSGIDCSFDEPIQVLYLTGHMHEHGVRFDFSAGPDAESLVPVVQMPTWEREYRDNPPVTRFAPGELTLPANAVLRTTCTWFNDSDQTLGFPEEMCTTAGMVYPSLTTRICSR